MSRRHRRLTGFGRTLRDYAEDRGIIGAPALAEKLTEAGYNSNPKRGKAPGVSRTTVDNWMKGRHDVPKEVLPYLEQVLELDEEKKARLAWALAWEQDFSGALVAA